MSVSLYDFTSVPGVTVHPSERRPLGGLVKRGFDVAFAVVVLLSSLLPIASIVLLMWMKNPGPIFFIHRRVGFQGRSFPCIKFRTMVVDSDKVLDDFFKDNPEAREEFVRTRKLRKDPRIISGVGEFLRRTSLDEIPQFLNVLRGEMSIVGPRPMVDDEVSACGPYKAYYLSARPGITGLWQVSGRSDLSFDDRVKLDAQYVANHSLGKDIVLIIKTCFVVLSCRGAY